MSTSLSEVLLRVASAIAPDGGTSVQAALEGVLRDAVPFEAGEVVFAPAHGEAWRQLLGTAEAQVLGDDLLAHVIAHGAAYRIDDWRDAEPFAETLGILRARALRSLIVVPFRCDGPEGPPLAGALALGRSHGWAFVGASLPLLVPLAAMAGLAFDRARVLTRLEERARPVEAPSLVPRSVPEPPAPPVAPPADPVAEVTARLSVLIGQAQQAAADRERERDHARSEAEALRREAEGAAKALRDECATSGDLRSRAEAAEARQREAEGSRDEWAKKATTLQAQTGELGTLIESLRHDLTGVQETAATAGGRAEAGRGRIRELEEQVEAGQGTIRALEEDREQGREDETRRLDEATARVAALEDELGRALGIQRGLELERSGLAARLDEAAERLMALERDRQALESARDEGEAVRARLAFETARLEAECLRLEGEVTQVEAELGIALDQIGALSAPAATPPSRGSRGGRRARGGRA